MSNQQKSTTYVESKLTLALASHQFPVREAAAPRSAKAIRQANKARSANSGGSGYKVRKGAKSPICTEGGRFKHLYVRGAHKFRSHELDW